MSQDVNPQSKPRRTNRWLLWLFFCLLLVAGGVAVYRWLNPRLVPVTRLVLPDRHIFLYNDCYGFPEAYVKLVSPSNTLWLLDECGQTREKTDLSKYRSSPFSAIPGFLQRLLYGSTPQTVFRNQECKLVIKGRYPRSIIISEQGHPDTIMSSAPDPWLFSEDGTVWKETGGKLHVLQWRSGKPTVTKIATPIVSDEHVLDFSRLPRRSVSALWGDGRCIAVAETLPVIPKSLWPVARKTATLINKHDSFPLERRWLTLYRDDKKIGTYSINLKPSGVKYPFWIMISPQYTEHLAFSRDGKYLAWCIDAGWGWQELVFKVQ